MFRRTFARLLEVLERPVGTASSPGSADLVLLDTGARDAGAAEQQYLATVDRAGGARIGCVLDEQDDAVIDTLMASGAAGVLLKASPPAVLIASLQLLVDGGACRPAPAFTIDRLELPEAVRHQLTAREQRMLRLMAGGHSIGHVARELSLTRARVVTDMRRIVQAVRGRDRGQGRRVR